MVPIMLAVEERFEVGVVLLRGLRANVRPEVDGINYVSCIRVPVLMMNGRYDMVFPFDQTVLPMFNIIGTPKEHKPTSGS